VALLLKNSIECVGSAAPTSQVYASTTTINMITDISYFAVLLLFNGITFPRNILNINEVARATKWIGFATNSLTTLQVCRQIVNSCVENGIILYTKTLANLWKYYRTIVGLIIKCFRFRPVMRLAAL
jgi:hypothetical protein